MLELSHKVMIWIIRRFKTSYILQGNHWSNGSVVKFIMFIGLIFVSLQLCAGQDAVSQPTQLTPNQIEPTKEDSVPAQEKDPEYYEAAAELQVDLPSPEPEPQPDLIGGHTLGQKVNLANRDEIEATKTSDLPSVEEVALSPVTIQNGTAEFTIDPVGLNLTALEQPDSADPALKNVCKPPEIPGIISEELVTQQNDTCVTQTSNASSSEATDEVGGNATDEVGSNATDREPIVSPPPGADDVGEKSEEKAVEGGSDHMPSFNEWALKRLAEQEKNGHAGRFSSDGKLSTVRAKNYASSDCGAKVLVANPEAQHSYTILNSAHDEYMLNPCTAKIWVVVELCEPIQASRIEIANYELFSSSPRNFSVSSSERYPTREWSLIGSFEARDEKTLQGFALSSNSFAKFLKIEMQSHYGQEHYCPLSVVNLFGNSELDMLDTDDNLGQGDGLNEEHSSAENKTDEIPESKNLFGTAKDAVLTMVKKATEAFNPKIRGVDSGGIIFENGAFNQCISFSRPEYYLSFKDDSNVQFLQCNYFNLVALLARLRHHMTNCTFCNVATALNTLSFVDLNLCRYVKVMLGNRTYDALCAIMRAETMFQDGGKEHCGVANHTVIAEVELEAARPNIINITIETGDEKQPIELQPSVNEDELATVTRDSSPADQTKTTEGSSVDASIRIATSDQLNEAVASESVVAAGLPELNQTEGVIIQTGVNNVSWTNGIEATATEASKPASVATPTPPACNGNSNGIHSSNIASLGQKESVFVRLSNRIRSLELNMSLSSQYLEELSQRYRKQMEEMQRAFNKTVAGMNETAHIADARDLKQQDVILNLVGRIGNLSDTVAALLDRERNIYTTVLKEHLILLLIEIFIFAVIFTMCFRQRPTRTQTQGTQCSATDHKAGVKPNKSSLSAGINCDIDHLRLALGKVVASDRTDSSRVDRDAPPLYASASANVGDNIARATDATLKRSDPLENFKEMFVRNDPNRGRNSEPKTLKNLYENNSEFKENDVRKKKCRNRKNKNKLVRSISNEELNSPRKPKKKPEVVATSPGLKRDINSFNLPSYINNKPKTGSGRNSPLAQGITTNGKKPNSGRASPLTEVGNNDDGFAGCNGTKARRTADAVRVSASLTVKKRPSEISG